MTDTNEPTRQLLDPPRIEVPTVNAPMARIPSGALAGGVHRDADFVHGLAVRTLVDQQIAQDTTQEVFVSLGASGAHRAWARDDGLFGPAPVSA
jgi:hypothetical protein